MANEKYLFFVYCLKLHSFSLSKTVTSRHVAIFVNELHTSLKIRPINTFFFTGIDQSTHSSLQEPTNQHTPIRSNRPIYMLFIVYHSLATVLVPHIYISQVGKIVWSSINYDDLKSNMGNPAPLLCILCLLITELFSLQVNINCVLKLWEKCHIFRHIFIHLLTNSYFKAYLQG